MRSSRKAIRGEGGGRKPERERERDREPRIAGGRKREKEFRNNERTDREELKMIEKRKHKKSQ